MAHESTDLEIKHKTLTFRKEYLYSKLQKVYDYSQKVSKNNIHEFLAQFNELESIRQRFEEIVLEIMQIEMHVNPKTKFSTKDLDSFETLYSGCRLVALKCQNSLSSMQNKVEQVRPSLPTLKLFEFDGRLENWTTFYDTFVSLVHDRNFEEIDKFHYLLSCVQGPALNLVKKYPITANNYSLAWKSLVEKYQDNRVLINSYLDKILNFTPITKNSVVNLNSFVETFDNSWKAIEALKVENLGNYLICHLALRALDSSTRKLFEESRDPKSLPTFPELINFVNKQVRVLEHTFPSTSAVVTSSERKTPAVKQTNSYNKPRLAPLAKGVFTAVTAQSGSNDNYLKNNKNKLSCAHCNQNHLIYRCEQFRKLSPEARIDRVNHLKLCTNCLKSNHDNSVCKSVMSCGVCALPHHYLLHTNRIINTASDSHTHDRPSQSHTQRPKQALVSACSLSNLTDLEMRCHAAINIEHYGVVLGTARLHITGACDSKIDCRAVIDSGAQCSFITMDCAQRLGLPRIHCPYSIYGLGGECVKNYGMITCTFESRYAHEPKFVANMVVVSKVSENMPNVSFPSSVIDEYKNYQLADPLYYKRSRVDILLGNDIVTELIKNKPLTIKENIPQVIETALGFIVSGKLALSTNKSTACLSLTVHDEQPLETTLRKFWEIEDLPCTPPSNPLDELAETIFSNLHSREPSGRYVVPLPIAPHHPPLGNSRATAERRLKSTERKLARSPELQRAYTDFMREYLALEHMEPYNDKIPSKYVVPHNIILRPCSSSTPARVVFDGSAKSSTNVSLNDILLIGPNLYRDILAIILNFRLFEFCLVSDVCKMYRAILLRKEDRIYQHILYRDSTDKPIQEYELKTVTYGLSCSPFLAIRTLLQLADDEGQRFPMAAQVIREGVYMDDILYSCDNIDLASQLQDELINLFKCGGFELKKWASNHPGLLQRVPVEQRECPVNFLKDENECTVRVLGLRWLPLSDTFCYVINVTDNINTKRSVLRLLASIYDPVGFLVPCLFVAKEFMQDLWKLGVGWDEPLPPHMSHRFDTFVAELPCLSKINIERHMLCPNTVKCDLVGFCDASSRGYACCIYVVSTDAKGNKKVSLVAAKSKVAPIKPLTIPRLELMAALLLSKLIKYVRSKLNRITINSITALTDSTIVLSWIQVETYKLKTFVCNRVVQITDILPSHLWRHVNSENNMADICSRGASPSQLAAYSSKWLSGPKWLQKSRSEWPVTTFVNSEPSSILELKCENKLITLLSTSPNEFNESKIEFCERMFSQFSSYTRLQHCCARILRLRYKVPDQPSTSKVLTTLELKRSQDVLVRMVQLAYFESEIISLTKGKYYIPSLRKLSPFLDEQGFIRVGGRLSHSDLPFNAKHPRLLPKTSSITHLIIKHYHVKYLHAGPRTLQNILNQNFWILSARRIIRSILSKCKVCFKCKPNVLQPKMGSLPRTRLLPNKLFDHVGVDLAGPFFVKESLRRNAKIERAYLAIFVCFSTKAVHLEALSSLSAECFLAALDRFVSRRGICSFIYSDCGKNFVASSKYLNEIYNFLKNKENNDKIIEGCTSRKIVWKFNPPSAPHMGGLWEAGIKSAKYHLIRSVGEKSLTFEELSTVFCKVEAILNSRPLCPLPASDNPNDFNVLTAGHFLIGKGLVSIPEYNVEDVQISRLSRWQYIQKCSQMFWNRWRTEYLNTLQQRGKWYTTDANINVNDLVLVKTDNVPPCNWPLARIEAVHPGDDGVIRCATIKTQKSVLKRPVNKLSPLPYVN